MIQFSDFVQQDWYGFAGATAPSEKQPPMSATMKVDGEDACVILDAECLAIYWDKDVDGNTENHEATTATLPGFVALKLNPEMTSAELRALGLEVA
jgi:hypothetical protein